MANNRIARTNDDIQRVLSELLRRVKDPRVQQGMLSVTRVETTGDLRYAKVWISAYGLENEKELFRGLKSASGWLRREMAHAMSLRYTPELVFELDHSMEYGAHISSMIRDLVPPEEETEASSEEQDALLNMEQSFEDTPVEDSRDD